MGKTITEKILSRVMGKNVIAGDIIYPEPELITVHDWYVVNFDKALKQLGVDKLYAPEKLIISTDHEPIAVSPLAAERQKQVREIVKKYGITNFFDAGRGGHGHIFPIEMGFVKPGMFVEFSSNIRRMPVGFSSNVRQMFVKCSSNIRRMFVECSSNLRLGILKLCNGLGTETIRRNLHKNKTNINK